MRLWKMPYLEGKQIALLTGHMGRVRVVHFSKSGSLASGGDDGTIYMWQVIDKTILHKFEGHTAAVLSVDFSIDGRTLASGSLDFTARVWDTESGQCLKVLDGEGWNINRVMFAPSIEHNDVIATLRSSGIKMWKASTGTCLFEKKQFGINDICLHPDGSTLAIAKSSDASYDIEFWNAMNGQSVGLVREVVESPDDCMTYSTNRVAFNAEASLVAATCEVDGCLRVWETATGKLRYVFHGHTDRLLGMCFTQDGKTIATSSYDQTVKLWNLDSGLCVLTIALSAEPFGICFHPTLPMIAIASQDRNISLWT